MNEYIDSRDNILLVSTIRGYNIIRKTRLQSIMNKRLGNLTYVDVQRAVNEDSRRLSRKSIKLALGLLGSVLDINDISMKLKRISIPQPKKPKQKIPEAHEIIKLFIGTDIEPPCLLAMWLSLRMSEVRGLKFKDISEDGNFITVRRARIYFDGKDHVRECNKTYESTRTNRLPNYLKRLIKHVPHESEEDFIVQQSYVTIYNHFKRITKDAGYDLTFHKLRHEFATTLNELNIPSEYIQKLGGWSSDNIMKSVYTHTTDKKEIEYQTRIDDYFEEIISNI